jgi:hypothetical protein
MHETAPMHDQHDCTNYEGKIFHVARHIWSRVPCTDKMSPQRVLNTHSSGKRCWTQFFVEFSQFSENLPYLRLGCSQLARWCSLAGARSLVATIANMLFNSETIVLKAELVSMWHAKNEYAMYISGIMAIFDHTSLHCWHCHSIIIIHGKERVGINP